MILRLSTLRSTSGIWLRKICDLLSSSWRQKIWKRLNAARNLGDKEVESMFFGHESMMSSRRETRAEGFDAYAIEICMCEGRA